MRVFWIWADCILAGVAAVAACRVDFFPAALTFGALAGGSIGMAICWIIGAIKDAAPESKTT